MLLTGDGFDPPQALPTYGVREGRDVPADGRPVVGIVYYRAHEIAGNTAFVDALADAVEAKGARRCRSSAAPCAGSTPSTTTTARCSPCSVAATFW